MTTHIVAGKARIATLTGATQNCQRSGDAVARHPVALKRQSKRVSQYVSNSIRLVNLTSTDEWEQQKNSATTPPAAFHLS